MICSVTVSLSRHCSLGTIWYKYQIFRLGSATQLDKNGGYVPLCILYSKQKLLVRQITNVYMTRIVLDYILSAHAFTSVRTEVSSMQQVHCRWAYVLAFQHKICINIPTLFFFLAQNGVLRMDNTLYLANNDCTTQRYLYNPISSSPVLNIQISIENWSFLHLLLSFRFCALQVTTLNLEPSTIILSLAVCMAPFLGERQRMIRVLGKLLPKGEKIKIVSVCVCVCVRERERERETSRTYSQQN